MHALKLAYEADMAQEKPALMFQKSHVERMTAHLNKECRDGANIEDVVALAEVSAESLKTFFTDFDHKLYGELSDIVDYINSMKHEVAGLGAKKLREYQIPEAGKELDAVVKSTAEATNRIMTASENLLCADTSDHEGYVAQVNDAVMEIFEACSFQDLTGQRISKVVDTLKMVEARLERFVNVLRITESEGIDTDEIKAKKARQDALYLHGPQFDGDAIQQNEVDELLNNTSELSDDAIARLFN